MKRQTALEIISFLFIFLFTYAALVKLMDPEKFRAEIGQSPLLTDIAYPISLVIPATEIIIAILLVFPRLRFMGLLMSLSLMATFTIYIIIIMNFSEQVPCSCGGVLQRMKWSDHLIFNIVFVILGIIGVRLQYIKTLGHTHSFKDILLQ